MIERMQPGLFAQFVVVPLFSEHQHPQPGRRPPTGGAEGAAAARRRRRRRRLVRRRAQRDDQARAAHADVVDAVRADGRRDRWLELGAELAELGALLDARGGPLLGARVTRPPAHRCRILRTRGDLDHDLPHRALDVVGELVPFLRHDRERRRLLRSARRRDRRSRPASRCGPRTRRSSPGLRVRVLARSRTRKAIACFISPPVAPIETSTPQRPIRLRPRPQARRGRPACVQNRMARANTRHSRGR